MSFIRKAALALCLSTTCYFLLFDLQAASYYVNKTGLQIPPYDTWELAATNLHVAVMIASNGDEVVVGPGTYALTNTVTITNGITLRSSNGYAVTIIDGSVSVRCVYLNNAGAVVRGFTVQNGLAKGLGGGICCYNGTIEDCFVVSNTVQHQAAPSHLRAYGGGVYIAAGKLLRSVIAYNRAVATGIWSDNDDAYGGGVCCNGSALVSGCVVFGNRALGYGAASGGGVCLWSSVPEVLNCSIVGNKAGDSAGGVAAYAGWVRNCIIYSNVLESSAASTSTNYEGSAGFTYCCTIPLITVWPGNITNSPSFADWQQPNLHLRADSPCIDAGTNGTWTLATQDLDGNPRIVNSTVDMGADEACVSGVAIVVTNRVETVWSTPVGARLQMQKNLSLVGGDWGAFGNVVTAQTELVTISDTTPPSKMPAFYRLIWLRE